MNQSVAIERRADCSMETIRAIQDYLHEHIPLSHAMGVTVLKADQSGVIVSAPLEPNINHRETVFGGSASSIAILAAWSVVHFGLQREGLSCRVVIQKNTMSYDKPMAGAFTARCDAPEGTTWQRFLATVRRKKMARIAVASILEYHGEIAGKMEGIFVAMRLD
jgi:thioesterase domain-containing protein